VKLNWERKKVNKSCSRYGQIMLRGVKLKWVLRAIKNSSLRLQMCSAACKHYKHAKDSNSNSNSNYKLYYSPFALSFLARSSISSQTPQRPNSIKHVCQTPVMISKAPSRDRNAARCLLFLSKATCSSGIRASERKSGISSRNRFMG
jgi:hypothetical protein